MDELYHLYMYRESKTVDYFNTINLVGNAFLEQPQKTQQVF